MAGAGVLFTVERKARARVRLNHEAGVRAGRRYPPLHRRRRIRRNELIGRAPEPAPQSQSESGSSLIHRQIDPSSNRSIVKIDPSSKLILRQN
jgi:hypothetical protein